jgi:CBS domain containing-hemolysin-like protein
MRIARNVLILVGLTFGIWEAIDIFWIDIPAVAAVFAVAFLACTAWFWRRGSTRAAAALLVLFTFEAAVALSLKHVMTVTKVAAFSLGVAGALTALAVIAPPMRRWATK